LAGLAGGDGRRRSCGFYGSFKNHRRSSTYRTEQLGYRKENIIDLRDASLADFERVFGSDANPGGEIAGRIDKKEPGDMFIYVASHGTVKEDDAKAVYLLPVNAKLDDLDKTAYTLQKLYDNLGKTWRAHDHARARGELRQESRRADRSAEPA
jgi:hypothetical protein